MKLIRAIAIDDEADSLSILSILLKKYCSNVQLVAQTTSPTEGILLIQKHQPDLVFLDISMPTMNGFELLQSLDYKYFEVIFTTAHDEYAIQAFKIGAVHYLLKPIDRMELLGAVNRVAQKLQQDQTGDINQLLQKIVSLRKPKIAIPTTRGIEMVNVDEIIYCEANSNYTVVYFHTTKKVVTKTLKEVEQQVQSYNFLRVHHSFLINLDHLKNYIKVEGFVEMSNGSKVSVSRSRKNDLMQFLNGME